MRIGLLADIHNDADSLARALAALDECGEDLLVTLGDTCDVFPPDDGIVEVATMLQEHHVIGVWGNHDFVLCRNVDDRYLSCYAGTPVLSYMAGMLPTLVVGDFDAVLGGRCAWLDTDAGVLLPIRIGPFNGSCPLSAFVAIFRRTGTTSS
jgi:hypothetical protein